MFAAIAATIAVIFSRAIGADAACDIFFLGGLDVGAALLAVVVGVAIALVSALTCAVALKLRRDRECDAAEICGARMASHCVQLVQNVKQVFCITSAYRFRERLYVTDSTYCAELVVRARLYWFRCFFGTEIGPKSVFTFRTQNEVTGLPHIVALLSRDSDSSVVASHVRTVHFLNAPFLDRLGSGFTDNKRTPLAAVGADGWSGLRVRWKRSIDSACPCFAYATPRGASSMRM